MVGVVGMVERLMVFSSREFYLEDLQIKMEDCSKEMKSYLSMVKVSKELQMTEQ